MSNARTKKYNKNRYRKVYQPVRALPIWGIHSDKEVVLETLTVKFDNTSKVSFALNARYSSLPGVVVTPVGEFADVNLFISSLELGSVPSGGGKTVTIVLEASTTWTGEAYIQVMMIV